MKLKYLKMYDLKDVPDHVIEEIKNMAFILTELINPFIEGKDPNLVLGAFNFIHAAMLQNLVAESDLEKGAKMAAYSLIKNIELLKGNDNES